jgi:hypothetical protein
MAASTFWSNVDGMVSLGLSNVDGMVSLGLSNAVPRAHSRSFLLPFLALVQSSETV